MLLSERPSPIPGATVVPLRDRPGGLEVLLVRRGATIAYGGMWAFPCAVRHRGEAVGAAAERAVREGLGIGVRSGAEIGAVRHVFTHVRVTYHAVRCASSEGDPLPLRYDAFAWVEPHEVSAYALPVAQRRIELFAVQARNEALKLVPALVDPGD